MYRENTADDPKCRCPDITKARTLLGNLGWEPKVKLADGLRFMESDFKTRVTAIAEREKAAASGGKRAAESAAEAGNGKRVAA